MYSYLPICVGISTCIYTYVHICILYVCVHMCVYIQYTHLHNMLGAIFYDFNYEFISRKNSASN